MNDLLTSKDLVAVKSLDTKNGQLHNLVELKKLRELALEWIKKDIEISEDSFLNSDDGKEYQKYADKLPNGKFCFCDPETSCPFHREGMRLMKFFNIQNKESFIRNKTH